MSIDFRLLIAKRLYDWLSESFTYSYASSALHTCIAVKMINTYDYRDNYRGNYEYMSISH